MQFQPGNLVNARGRVWVVQSDSTDDWLLLRPLGGTDDEITHLIPQLEKDPVTSAQFALPDPKDVGSFSSARLLYNALRFQLRSSSGPFRCFGSINFEPRSYQFVPLLMAMRQKVVRLLIADDVGVGKTIESGLIVRELIDRGEVQRFAVLCPPHLVEQWCDELELHFNLKATALTANTSQHLERLVPHGHMLTEYCPYLVVSLDYIKSDKHRDYFENMPLDLVLVDEAHTCVRSSGTKQKRFDLLQKVTKDPQRHLLLLTATPHSGNEDAFFNLLSLLDEKFLALKDSPQVNSHLRNELAEHFIQRRRQDIKEWRAAEQERLTGFPIRNTADLTYKMDPLWHEFFEKIQDYCTDFILQYEANGELNIHSAAIYETIALLRCASSSPAAAIQTLSNRLSKLQSKAQSIVQNKAALPDGELLLQSATTTQEPLISYISDIDDADGSELNNSAEFMLDQELNGDESTELSDQEPSLLLTDSKELNKLITQGRSLMGMERDPKLKLTASLVYDLVQSGFQPVIFCRFISTAHYVADQLKSVLCIDYQDSDKSSKGSRKGKKNAAKDTQASAGLNLDTPIVLQPIEDLKIGCVTGDLVPEDRRLRVEELMTSPRRILVATDCLSEGINLQQGFTAVIHYDLAWNPTRHEQREGRVDRFGQTASEVRCAMIYCEDNLLDQLINNVILQKNKNIQKALGVTVPVPQQAEFIEKSILLQMLTGRQKSHQSNFLNLLEADGALSAPAPKGEFDAVSAPDRFIEQLNIKWENSLQKANKQITIFAQKKIHPEEIAPIWQEQQNILGSFNDVLDFASQGCAAFSCKLEPVEKKQRRSLRQAISNFTWHNVEQGNSEEALKESNQRFYFPMEDISDLTLRQNFRDEGFTNRQIIDFNQMYRASPFISILASSIVEHVMSGQNSGIMSAQNSSIHRCGIANSEYVDKFTSIYLLRLRFQMRLTYNQQVRRNLMVEEIVPIMVQGINNPQWDLTDKARQLIMQPTAAGNFSQQGAQKHLQKAIELIQEHPEQLTKLSNIRAEKLKQEHSSIKQFTSDGHVTHVQPCGNADIMGIYVLLPVLE